MSSHYTFLYIIHVHWINSCSAQSIWSLFERTPGHPIKINKQKKTREIWTRTKIRKKKEIQFNDKNLLISSFRFNRLCCFATFFFIYLSEPFVIRLPTWWLLSLLSSSTASSFLLLLKFLVGFNKPSKKNCIKSIYIVWRLLVWPKHILQGKKASNEITAHWNFLENEFYAKKIVVTKN